MRSLIVSTTAIMISALALCCQAAEPSKPMRAGMIGLDTGHAVHFTQLLSGPAAVGELAEMKIVAAYPGGSPDIPDSWNRVKEHTKLVRQMNVEIVGSIDEVLKTVDYVFLETLDGRPHLAQARQVIAAQKPLFIDKPMAVSLADAMEIFRLAKESNVPCFSSSSLRFTPGLQAVREGKSKFGDVRDCVAWSPLGIEPHHPDLFWYGIHGVETLFAILGPGCKTVTRVAPDKVVGIWRDGRKGTYLGKDEMGATIEGAKGSGPGPKYEDYRPLVTEIVKFFKTGKPPVSAEETLEVLAFMEAADESKRENGRPVEIESVMKRASETVAAQDSPKLIAETYDSGFKFSHDTYNGMGVGSDGKIYYVLSTTLHDVAGQMYCFDPATRRTKHLGDLTEACGEKNMKMVAQGKIHCNFVEHRGRLYFATHTGFYAIIDDMEKMGPPPEGWKPYQGGHFLSYDMATGKFKNLALAPGGEGIITMNMDVQRGRLYGLTWPTSRFIRYDLAKKEMKDLGPMALDGENGKGAKYRTICRAFAVDPTDGAVYFSNGDGDILRYDYGRETIEPVKGENLKKDYFGLYDPTSPGHMGYNWRQVFWHPTEKSIYGVHGNSGFLFRFDPRAVRLDVLERLTSTPSKRCGMFDQFSYGYLGFGLGPDHRTIYYLTGGPIYVNGKRVTGKDVTGKGEAKGLEDLHLVTYDIPTAKVRDHGAIFMQDGQRPLYVNSLTIGKDGSVYTLCRINRNGHTQTDLLSVPAKSIDLGR